MLLVITGAGALAAADYDEASHPDGSLHYKIKLDREGRRDGPYVCYYPSGKSSTKGPKSESGTYRNGERNGVITTLAVNGEVVSESQWVMGRCMVPITERFIAYSLERIDAAAKAAVAALPADDSRPRPDASVLAAVLARTNHYRLLCGLDYDVVLDANFIHEAQCAAEVCAAMGKLDHHPAQNPGLAEETWQAGKKGCGKSNLAMGGTSAKAIDMWMDDSDDSNRDRVGHRRWLLWPELDRMGYGESGRFSAGHVIDGKGKSEHVVPAVMFPPQGLMPVAMFGSRYCWHLSPDPALYTIAKDAKLSIHPYNPKTGEKGPALEIQFANVEMGSFGERPAVIAQPKQLTLKAGAMYRVEVTGVDKKKPDAPDLGWVTIFY